MATLTDQVLETRGNGTAHFTSDGETPECGTSVPMTLRPVADSEAFVNCSKCRKAHGLVFMVGPAGKPEFNTGRRVFGR